MLPYSIYYIYLAALPILSVSCIFEDEENCPAPEYTAEISVKDINYNNVSKFSHIEVKDNGMPFHRFTETIYYTLSDMSGINIIESALLYTGGDSRTYPVSFGDIPAGEYILTVWGNLTEEYAAGTLHPDGQEYTDIYTGRRKVRFDDTHRMTELALERTKGLLLLSCSGFPDDVSWIKMSVSDIYNSTDADLNYTGSANLEKTMPFQPFTTTLLSPSAKKPSVLKLSFHTDNSATSEPFLKLPDINLTIRRNEISSVAIDCNDKAGMYELQILINDHWVMTHRLYIN